MLVSSISTLLIGTLLIGMLLGLRFKVLIVAPASLGAMLFAICVGIMHADAPWKIGLGAAAAIACLQIGYVAGAIMLSRLGSGLVPGYNGPSPGFGALFGRPTDRTAWICSLVSGTIGKHMPMRSFFRR